MRILEIDRGGDELVQGFVRAEWPQRASIAGGAASAWIKMFLRSASLWSQAKPLSASVRIAIEPGRPVTTVHSFVVARRDEARLRLVLAAFMRTDQMGAGHTEGPQEDEDLEGRYLHPEEPRFAMVRESLRTAKGLAIHHNLRLADQLPRLLQTFADLAVPFAYELQAMPWSPPREPLREFLHNVARLSATPGIPPRLARDQEALAERIKSAAFNIEECLSTQSEQLAGAVEETLASLLGETFYAGLGAAPRVAPLDQDRAQAFAHHVHSALMLDSAPPTMADSDGRGGAGGCRPVRVMPAARFHGGRDSATRAGAAGAQSRADRPRRAGGLRRIAAGASCPRRRRQAVPVHQLCAGRWRARLSDGG